MTGSLVLMIVIGFILIFLSFFLSEKFSKKEENYNLDLMTVDEDYEFSERELRIIKRKIEDVIAKQAKDILYETNESLSNMANEKTMALGDYAVTVCEEIEKNHKEVMFLYSMLDDKQKEIMNTVKRVDETSHDVKELLADVKESSRLKLDDIKISKGKTSAIDQLSALSKKKKELISENRQDDVQESNVAEEVKQVEQNEVAEETFKEITDDHKARIVQENPSVQPEEDAGSLDDVFAEIDNTDIDFDDVLDEEFKENENSNDIILEMHRNGNSIIEIAKQLGLGVGEVKLVIDLYQGE